MFDNRWLIFMKVSLYDDIDYKIAMLHDPTIRDEWLVVKYEVNKTPVLCSFLNVKFVDSLIE